MGAWASASESTLKPRVGCGGQRGGLPGLHRPPQSRAYVSFRQCHPLSTAFAKKFVWVFL